MARNRWNALTWSVLIVFACGGFPDRGLCDDPVSAVAQIANRPLVVDNYKLWCAQFSTPLKEYEKLRMTQVFEDDRRLRTPLVLYTDQLVTGVAHDGRTIHSAITTRGRRGGGGQKVETKDLQRLDRLLANLPDDDGRLPTSKRRILLQANIDGAEMTRVYDSYHIFDDLAEILSLCDANIQVDVPKFSPVMEKEVWRDGGRGFLSPTPDGKFVVFPESRGPLKLWDVATQQLRETRHQGSELWAERMTFHPKGSLAVISGNSECEVVETKDWQQLKLLSELTGDPLYVGLSDPKFTPDGKFLIIHCTKFRAEGFQRLRLESLPVQVYDTATWRQVPHCPGLPEKTVFYAPARKQNLALICTADSGLKLWDTKRQQAFWHSGTRWGNAANLVSAVFSPDETQVAVLTHDRNSQLRLWPTEAGKEERELRPYGRSSNEGIAEVFWSTDGRYLFAETRTEYSREIGISAWNAANGRHRGVFIGCTKAVRGAGITADGKQLVAGCDDGKIRYWDFPAAMKSIERTENPRTSNPPD